MPARVILHQIHVKRLWPQSWALQISIWDKWTWAHQEPDWLRPVHTANPGLLSGAAEDHRAFWEEIDNDLNLEMSVTWVSFFSLVEKKEVGEEVRWVKERKEQRRATTNWGEEWVLKKCENHPESHKRDTSAFYSAVQFLHNTVHSQQYFSFQHLSQVRHTVHSKYPDL